MDGAAEGNIVYEHRRDLFIRNGIPIKFRMRPSVERRNIKGYIEHGGGVVSGTFTAGGIRLAPPGSFVSMEDTVSTDFIKKCVAANKLLNSEKFILPKSKPVDSDNDDDSISTFNFDRVERKSKTKASGRISRTYSNEEDVDILNYIMQDERFRQIKGNVIWKEMEHKKVTHHSWQSMKNRLTRNIVHQLSKYHSISEDFKKKLADFLNVCYTVSRTRGSSQAAFDRQTRASDNVHDTSIGLPLTSMSQKSDNPPKSGQKGKTAQAVTERRKSSTDSSENSSKTSQTVTEKRKSSTDSSENSSKRLTRSISLSNINDRREPVETENGNAIRGRQTASNVLNEFISSSVTNSERTTNSGFRQGNLLTPKSNAVSVKSATSLVLENLSPKHLTRSNSVSAVNYRREPEKAENGRSLRSSRTVIPASNVSREFTNSTTSTRRTGNSGHNRGNRISTESNAVSSESDFTSDMLENFPSKRRTRHNSVPASTNRQEPKEPENGRTLRSCRKIVSASNVSQELLNSGVASLGSSIKSGISQRNRISPESNAVSSESDSPSDLVDNVASKHRMRRASGSSITNRRELEEPESRRPLRSCRKIVPASNVSQESISSSVATSGSSVKSRVSQRNLRSLESNAITIESTASPDDVENIPLKRRTRSGSLSVTDKQKSGQTEKGHALDKSWETVNGAGSVTALERSKTSDNTRDSRLNPESAADFRSTTPRKRHPTPGVNKSKRMKCDEKDTPLKPESDSSKHSQNFGDSNEGKPLPKKIKLHEIVSSDSSNISEDDCPRMITRARTPMPTPKRGRPSKVTASGSRKGNQLDNAKIYSLNKKSATRISEHEGDGACKRRTKITGDNPSKVSRRHSTARSTGGSSDSESETDSRQGQKVANTPSVRTLSRQLSSDSDSDISSASTVVSPYNQACLSLSTRNSHQVNNRPTPISVVPKPNLRVSGRFTAPVIPENSTSERRSHLQGVKKLAPSKSRYFHSSVSDEPTDYPLAANCGDKPQDRPRLVPDLRKLPHASPLVKDVLSVGLQIINSELDSPSELESEASTVHDLRTEVDFCVLDNQPQTAAAGNSAEEDMETHENHLEEEVSRPPGTAVASEISKSVAHISDASDSSLRGLPNQSPEEIIGPSNSADLGQIEVVDLCSSSELDRQSDHRVKLNTPPSSAADFNIPCEQPVLPKEEIVLVSPPNVFTEEYLSTYFDNQNLQEAQPYNVTIRDAFQDVDDITVSSNETQSDDGIETPVIKKSVAVQTEDNNIALAECAVQTEDNSIASAECAVQTEDNNIELKDCTVQTEASGIALESRAVQTEDNDIVLEDCAVQTESIVIAYKDSAVQTNTSDEHLSECPALRDDQCNCSSVSQPSQERACQTVTNDCAKKQEDNLFGLQNALAQKVVENAVTDAASASGKTGFNNTVVIVNYLSKILNVPVQDLHTLLSPRETGQQNQSKTTAENSCEIVEVSD